MKHLIILLCFLFSIHNSYAQSDDLQNVIAAANSGLQEWLQKIPEGKESLYGFRNRNDFATATIGRPYEIKTLNSLFFSDAKLTEKNYLISTGEWRVPILVNGEYHSLLTIGKMNDRWVAVGLGAAGLAQELGAFEKNYPSFNQKGILLRVHQLKCDFILFALNNSQSFNTVYPLKSAAMAMYESMKTNSSFPLSQALSLIKKEIVRK